MHCGNVDEKIINYYNTINGIHYNAIITHFVCVIVKTKDIYAIIFNYFALSVHIQLSGWSCWCNYTFCILIKHIQKRFLFNEISCKLASITYENEIDSDGGWFNRYFLYLFKKLKPFLRIRFYSWKLARTMGTIWEH